ncbi:MAG: DUF4111 domain-containing protein [Chloroflexi bacterium]|nr:DUF4111 domain-containing protein [Chloroflexota bacterium]
MIDPVEEDDLRGAVKAGIDGWWEPMIRDPQRLETPEYQPFAVLSMCRTLYNLQYGSPISKSAAANWGIRALHPEWTDLISNALSWRRCDPIEGIERTVVFMRYAFERSKTIEN